MHFSLRLLFEAVAVAGTVGCLVFYALALVAAKSFLSYARNTRAQKTLAPQASDPQASPRYEFPGVSILKPLKGTDPETWENFCSHAEQQYPNFELVFGVSDPLDPVQETVRQLQVKYPNCSIKLVVCDRILGANVKVSTLAQMLPHASHEFLVVNDSDIRVAPDYLRNIVLPLIDGQTVARTDLQVGLVTCPYRGVAGNTIGAQLEALGIATDFIPGVLTARYLENGLHFGLGSTLAFRRQDLAAIGGFESILDYLADDYELGRRIAATGKRIELTAAPVVTFLPPYTFREFWNHQMRWWRTIRDSRRGGYAGLLFTFGLPWALLTLLLSGFAPWAVGLLALTLALRFAVGYIAADNVLHDREMFRREAPRNVPLLLLRDLIAPVIWLMAFAGNKINWRGDWFYLKNGRLTPVPKPASTH